jgi:hypothetical protein
MGIFVQVPMNICMWAAKPVNLNRYRISYLVQTGRKGFWATIGTGPEMVFNR